MFYAELQIHFKKFGMEHEVDYFGNPWFLAHKEKYEFMLLNDIDPTDIYTWANLEATFGTAFLYEQAMDMADSLFEKFNVTTGELEHKLRRN
jgi:hypothetical protein